MASEKKQFNGSCKCGHITYTLSIPATNPINATRCNCTFCTKLGTTNFRSSPSDFKLLTPSTPKDLGDFNNGSATIHRYFCNKCGVHVWSEGSYEFEGKTYDHFSVNLRTVDQPQEGIDLSEVKIKYFDGLHDNWYAELADKPWSGGLV